MEIDMKTMKELISLGYIARENGLDMEDVVEMVERGFVAMHPEAQLILA